MEEILIIGKSKLAKTISKYLIKNNVKYKLIRFRDLDFYKDKLQKYNIILITTKDDFIEETYKKIKAHINRNTAIFHFSGSLYFKNMTSIHPIFPFKNKTLDPIIFEKIIFTSENPRYVRTKLKWLKNKVIKIEKTKKTLYHALLSIYLNLPLIIKSTLENEISKKFNISKIYLQKVFLENIKNNQITGPIVRNDKKVIKLHLKSLLKTEYYLLYLATLNLWRKKNENR